VFDPNEIILATKENPNHGEAYLGKILIDETIFEVKKSLNVALLLLLL
jgi:hypothetical protein